MAKLSRKQEDTEEGEKHRKMNEQRIDYPFSFLFRCVYTSSSGRVVVALTRMERMYLRPSMREENN
jgi:hypothetical protein